MNSISFTPPRSIRAPFGGTNRAIPNVLFLEEGCF
jgi:hypothetical protein